jgi:hypothetical protein
MLRWVVAREIEDPFFIMRLLASSTTVCEVPWAAAAPEKGNADHCCTSTIIVFLPLLN